MRGLHGGSTFAPLKNPLPANGHSPANPVAKPKYAADKGLAHPNMSNVFSLKKLSSINLCFLQASLRMSNRVQDEDKAATMVEHANTSIATSELLVSLQTN